MRAAIIVPVFFLFLCGQKQQEQTVTSYHTEKIFINEQKDTYLKLLIPDGYRLNNKKGPDFILFYAKPVDTSGLKSKATLGIYIGHHPNRFFPEGDSINLTTSEVGQRYQWRSWVEADSGKSAIVSDAIDDKLLVGIMPNTTMGNVWELQIHFFINATDERISRLLMRSAESVELVRQ